MSNHEQGTLYVEQQQLSLDDKQSCDRCGAPFSPRRSSGGSRQRFCTSSCRLTFHRERLRSQRSALYAGPTTLPATAQPAPKEQAGEAEGRFVLMKQQGFIKVVRDGRGNVLLRQGGDYEGDHELRICRDNFPRFLEALDVLRELIAEAIREDEAS
jgi:hypothetical protein